MIDKCEARVITLFPSPAVKGFWQLCIMDEAEMARFGPGLDCLAIQIGFLVPSVDTVTIKVANDYVQLIKFKVCIQNALFGGL